MSGKPRIASFTEIVDRFWSHVEKSDGCWEWKATRNQFGYGRFWNRSKLVVAHRFSWELHNGPIPDEMCVLHKCDNPPCVNPEHLFLGTYKDNGQDMVKKGRSLFGERHSKTNLTEEQVIEIRRRDQSGERIKSISDSMGIHYKIVQSVANGLTWKHLIKEPVQSRYRLANKLSVEKVIEIRKLHSIGHSQAKIGSMFGVSGSTIGSIIRGEKWNHV